MKWIDPIVEDVRTARENLWEACGYDLDWLCEVLREGRRHIVRWLSPKPNYPDGILGGRVAGTIERTAKFGAMI